MVVPSNGEVRLPDGKPHPFDVITRKGRENIHHVGNNRFRVCVEMRVDRYVKATSRYEKTIIIREIIETVRNGGGRFIRQHEPSSDETTIILTHNTPQHEDDDGGEVKSQAEPIYYEISNKKAADKAGHAMRLAVSKQEESKLRRRKSWPAGSSVLKEKPSTRKAAPENHLRKLTQPRRSMSNASSSIVSFDHDHEEPMRRLREPFSVFHESNVKMGYAEASTRCTAQAYSKVDHVRRAVSSRRQSWHAGYPVTDEKLFSRWNEVVPIQSDLSLSSEAWDLNNLEADHYEHPEDETDDCSFGSISSKECILHTGPFYDFGDIIDQIHPITRNCMKESSFVDDNQDVMSFRSLVEASF